MKILFTRKPTKYSIGYCHSPKHKGFISKDVIKCRCCVKRQCSCLQVFEDKPYWISYYEQIKRKKSSQILCKEQRLLVF